MKAKLLFLSGELVQGQEAINLGLVNFLVSKDQLENEVFEFALNLIRNNSAHSMALTKRMIDHVQSMSLADALKYAAEMNAKARASDDCKKGIAAFLKKENLNW